MLKYSQPKINFSKCLTFCAKYNSNHQEGSFCDNEHFEERHLTDDYEQNIIAFVLYPNP